MPYQLILTDTQSSNCRYTEDFCIGFFATPEQAETVARAYLDHIPGFCDFPCTHRVIPRPMKPTDAPIPASGQIWVIQGWDVNERGDEIHILESDCLPSEAAAAEELNILRRQHTREEWTIQAWLIGACA